MQAGAQGIPWRNLGAAVLMLGVAGSVAALFAFLGLVLAVIRPAGRLPMMAAFLLPVSCLIPFAFPTTLMSWLGGWLYLKLSKQGLVLHAAVRPSTPLRFSLRTAFRLTLAISIFMAIGRMLRMANLGPLAVLLALAVFAAIAVWSAFRAGSSPWLAIAYWISALGVVSWLCFATGQTAGALVLTACFSVAYAATLQLLLQRLRNRGYGLASAPLIPLIAPEEPLEKGRWIPWATYQPKRRPTL
ncbi:MAG: hypothetical protein U0836_28220 [Pirellulales bacterium]